MSKIERLRHNTVVSILLGRWEPLEVVLSISAVVHGLWLHLPYWNSITDSITPAPRIYEQALGTLLFVAGAGHLAGLATGWFQLRKQASFLKFMMWGFLTWLAFFAAGASSILWFPYATITLLSGLVYLSISVGVDNGTN